MVDNAGTNYCGVWLVFRIEYMTNKVIACQWHFLHNMDLLAHTMDEKDRNMFIQYCSNLLEATTVTQYQLICGLLSRYTKKYLQVKPKVKWWHVCWWLVFLAFRSGPMHSGVNLTEIGNKTWKTTGSNLSLLAAAKDAVACFFSTR